MSWLLGRFAPQQPDQLPSADVNAGSAPAGVGGNKQPPSEEGKKWVGFDPTGLERAAKAARELDASSKLIVIITGCHNSVIKWL